MKEGTLAKIAKRRKGRKEGGHSCLPRREEGPPFESNSGGQECPPSLNSCSGEAGSLRGLCDLCER